MANAIACGTRAGYEAHRDAGEYPCAQCMEDRKRRSLYQYNRLPTRICGCGVILQKYKHKCGDCRQREYVRPGEIGAPDIYRCEGCGLFVCRPERKRGQSPKWCILCRGKVGSDRRRARMQSAYVADVNRRDAFERDGWRCQLCGRMVDRNRKWPHPMSPSIDHIIPLAAGGTHEPINVQCAHLSCNARKGARGGGQLRLFG